MAKKIHVRPGRSQSKAGFAVGIVFCLIGVFVVIPIFGVFGILWTAAAGWITFVNYRNGFTDKQIDSKVIEIDGEGEDITVTSHTGLGGYRYEVDGLASSKDTFGGSESENVEARLRKLQGLYDQALITKDEYDRKKKEILEDL